jgi:hypothetical protein
MMAKRITIIAIACLLIPLLFIVAGNVNYATGAPVEINLPAIDETELPPEVQAWIEERIEEQINTTLIHGDKQYILVARGMKPTAGYSIQISKVEKADGNIVVHTEIIDPNPDDMVAEVITYPYDITVIDYQDLPVRFK